MLPNVEYENLKQVIINKVVNSTDIKIVKCWFQRHINSHRSFSKVKTINDLLNLLEIRDILHCNDVTVLRYLGEKLNNKEIVNLVKGYEKLYVEQTSCICCGSNSFSPPNLTEENKNSDEYLYQVINNIALNIGTHWRTLASELKVPEHYIDEIREKYPSDTFKQALNALMVWKKYNEDAATLSTLKTALEARLCKIKGLGLHLLKPVIIVE